jgi:hypothetical protein
MAGLATETEDGYWRRMASRRAPSQASRTHWEDRDFVAARNSRFER